MATVTPDIRVGNLMSIDPVTISPDAPVADAESLLGVPHLWPASCGQRGNGGRHQPD